MSNAQRGTASSKGKAYVHNFLDRLHLSKSDFKMFQGIGPFFFLRKRFETFFFFSSTFFGHKTRRQIIYILKNGVSMGIS